MSKFNSTLRLPAKPPRAPLKTEILWGCELGGSPHFPKDMETIHVRRNSHDPRPLETFRIAVMNAVDRVWIMDEYFLVPHKRASREGHIESARNH